MLKKCIPFTVKLTAKLTYNKNVFFSNEEKKKKSVTFTPPKLKFNALSFQNSFSFGSSSYPKKYWEFEVEG